MRHRYSTLLLIAIALVITFSLTGYAQEIAAFHEFDDNQELPEHGDHTVSYTAKDNGFVLLQSFGTKKEAYYGLAKYDAALNKKWSKQLVPNFSTEQKFFVHSAGERIYFFCTNRDAKTKLTELFWYQFDLEGNMLVERKSLHSSKELNGVHLAISDNGEHAVLIPGNDLGGHLTLTKGKTAMLEVNYFALNASQNTMEAKKASISGIKDMYLRNMAITQDGQWRMLCSTASMEFQLLNYNPATNTSSVLVSKIAGYPCSLTDDDFFIVANYLEADYLKIKELTIHTYQNGKSERKSYPLAPEIVKELAQTASEHQISKVEVMEDFIPQEFIKVKDGFYFYAERCLTEYQQQATKSLGDPDTKREDLYNRVAQPVAYASYELLVSFINTSGKLEWMRLIDKSCWTESWMPKAVPVVVKDELYFVYENREKKFYVSDFLFSEAEAMIAKIDRQGNITKNTLFPEYKMWNGFYNHRSFQVSDKTALLVFYKKEVKKWVMYRLDFEG